MKWFYIRWGGILFVALMITLLGTQRYYREVATMSPEQLLREQPTGTVRVLGRVQAGSLSTPGQEETSLYRVTFYLSGEREGLRVRYIGGIADNLRELKTLVVIGRWDLSTREFEAHEISLLPNYGYVAAAYLIGIVPIGLFLFLMERRVELLYNEIKAAKAYESEVAGFDKG